MEMEGPKAFLRPALKPIIRELVRTQVCFPNIQLLLDRIMVTRISKHEDGRETEAFRLYLSDGEKSIQALLKRRLYKMIVLNEAYEGSYLQIKDYALACAKRTNGKGSVTYIVLKEFYPIGYDGRSFQESWAGKLSTQKHTTISNDAWAYGKAASLHISEFAKQQSISAIEPVHNSEAQDDHLLESQHMTVEKLKDNVRPMQAASPSQHRKRRRDADDALQEVDPNSQSSPSKSARAKTENECRTRAVHQETSVHQEALATSKRKGESMRSSANAAGSNPPNCTFESLLCTQSIISRPSSRSDNPRRPIKTPLRLISLSSLEGYHRRNDIYDVFAVVYSVSDMVVKRSRMPAKRDIRIVDPSTDKKVLLSVFVDPADFKPRVGQIALIRNLTTHEWDGGMLNAYPKQCGGKEWFIPDPQATPGCNLDFMREWWTDKVIEEAEERMREEQLKGSIANGRL